MRMPKRRKVRLFKLLGAKDACYLCTFILKAIAEFKPEVLEDDSPVYSQCIVAIRWEPGIVSFHGHNTYYPAMIEVPSEKLCLDVAHEGRRFNGSLPPSALY